jgi:hypothetical protein
MSSWYVKGYSNSRCCEVSANGLCVCPVQGIIGTDGGKTFSTIRKNGLLISRQIFASLFGFTVVCIGNFPESYRSVRFFFKGVKDNFLGIRWLYCLGAK